jgi:hypothetical protein
MAVSGDFEINGRDFHYEVTRVVDEDGEEWTGSDIEDHLVKADQVFYVAETETDDDEIHQYYRWLGGPFDDLSQLEAAIADETDTYEGAE